MTDQLLHAWLLACDDDFGGSLDDEAPPPHLGRTSSSGIPYCYKIPTGWQVRIPGVKTRKFDAGNLAGARALVALHVEVL